MLKLLDMIFQNIIIKIKTKINNKWEKYIDINSSYEILTDIPHPNPINTSDYSPNFSLH